MCLYFTSLNITRLSWEKYALFGDILGLSWVFGCDWDWCGVPSWGLPVLLAAHVDCGGNTTTWLRDETKLTCPKLESFIFWEQRLEPGIDMKRKSNTWLTLNINALYLESPRATWLSVCHSDGSRRWNKPLDKQQWTVQVRLKLLNPNKISTKELAYKTRWQTDLEHSLRHSTVTVNEDSVCNRFQKSEHYKLKPPEVVYRSGRQNVEWRNFIFTATAFLSESSAV